MKARSLLFVTVLAGLCASVRPVEAQLQAAALANPDSPTPAKTDLSILPTGSETESDRVTAEAQAIDSTGQDSHTLPQVYTPLTYRLEIWGDLFTPSEREALRVSSDLLSSARAMIRAESPSSLRANARASGGSAYAGAISSSLVFGVTSHADAWPALTRWAVPTDTLRESFESEAIPMGWDLAERSRNGAPGAGGGSSTWLERAVAILPMPAHSLGWEAGAAGLRLGTLSLLSGNWPSFDRMSGADFAAYCRLWARRTINLALGNLLPSLMTPRDLVLPGSVNAGRIAGVGAANNTTGVIRAERVRMERAHPAPPVTLYYTF